MLRMPQPDAEPNVSAVSGDLQQQRKCCQKPSMQCGVNALVAGCSCLAMSVLLVHYFACLTIQDHYCASTSECLATPAEQVDITQAFAPA